MSCYGLRKVNDGGEPELDAGTYLRHIGRPVRTFAKPSRASEQRAGSTVRAAGRELAPWAVD